MSEFQMALSPDVHELLDGIVHEMIRSFGISRAEAIARINEQWHGQDLTAGDEIILHEDEQYWALFIYFGPDIQDWRPEGDRVGWHPRPMPAPDSGYWTVAE